jgi:hypothetical protein
VWLDPNKSGGFANLEKRLVWDLDVHDQLIRRTAGTLDSAIGLLARKDRSGPPVARFSLGMTDSTGPNSTPNRG